MSKMTEAQKKGIFKAAVVVHDKAGFPNYMTMFYMEPGTYKPEDVPDMFRVQGKTVPAVLISQYTNTMLNGVPVSLPYQQPAESMGHDESAAACRKKGEGWHLMTNTEWVYLLEEAAQLGHTIGGNTDRGKNFDNTEEKGVLYDGFSTLTGLDPVTWSHDGTKDGVFGLCGNFWERVAGLRLRRGRIEYIKNNDAAAEDYGPEETAWTEATTEDEDGLPFGFPLYLDAQCGKVTLTDGQIAGSFAGDHMKDVQLAGSLKEVPEVIYKLGILPRNWKEEKAGIWIDSTLEEAVPFRGSSFSLTSNGGAAALHLNDRRSLVDYRVSFRSAFIDTLETEN